MLNSKRIAKLQKRPTSPTITQLEPFLDSEEPKKVPRCRFRQIPQNSKYVHLNLIYPLYGDIPLMGFQGSLTTEISLFNISKTYKNVVVKEIFNTKIIAVRPTAKKGHRFLSQAEILEELAKVETADMTEWAKVIKVFYQKYDKVMKRQTRKRTKSDTRKKFYVQVTAKTEQKRKELHSTYPCYELRFRLKNHQSQLHEVLFNENCLKELGYSIDSFVTTVLKEGLPQVLAYGESSSITVRKLIESYFKIENSGFESPPLESTLVLKNGFVKKIQYKMHILMNYETNTFGMDIIWAILGNEEPYLAGEKDLADKVNEGFIQEMISRESEADYFLSVFYNQPIERRYTNLHKICTVKEISAL